jgi:hypothetical protein
MKRKTYPLRINPDILTALQQWANDDLRSVNAQIEFVLRESLIKAGRLKRSSIVESGGTDDNDQRERGEREERAEGEEVEEAER